jgi:hypothetical protein
MRYVVVRAIPDEFGGGYVLDKVPDENETRRDLDRAALLDQMARLHRDHRRATRRA